jgi:uncharacterized protein YdaU (DUF1376 family)
MTDLPFIPLYVPDFDSATSFLTLEEEGLYFRLLRLMWQTPGCSVPDDNAWLSRRLRTDDTDLIRRVTEDFCQIGKGRIFQKRLQEEFSNAKTLRTARKKAGKAGAVAKYAKTKEKDPSKSKVLPLANGQQPHSKAIASTTTVTTTVKEEKNIQKRASVISRDWTPDEKLIQSIADKHSCSTKAVKNEVYNFVNYWAGEGKAKKDWSATFRNWCAKDWCPVHKDKGGKRLSETPEDFTGQKGISYDW